MPSENSRNTKIVPIGVSEVIFIHYFGIDLVFEGYSSPQERRGFRDQGELCLSALARPHQTFAGNDLHKGLFRKAAVLLHGMTKNHPFIDGNKRTALLCSLSFLRSNGYGVNANMSQLVRLMRSTTRGKSVEQIERWLKKHSYSINSAPGQRAKDPELLRRTGMMSVLFHLTRHRWDDFTKKLFGGDRTD